MRRLSDLIRDYFGFSATEMRGYWFLLSLSILLLLVTPFLQFLFYQPFEPGVGGKEQRQLDSLIALLDSAQNQERITPINKHREIAYSHFDPNSARREVLLQNGFPTWLADRIISYRNKGGKFKNKKDLLKIYGLTEERYQEIADYIQLPDEYPDPITQKVAFETKPLTNTEDKLDLVKAEIQAMDINIADSLELRQIPGIGEVLSARIVRFRDQLGGIHDANQLAEVYHLSPEALENLLEYTYVSENFQLQKININTADVSTLAKHPYISFPLAKAIVRHREIYGEYKHLVECQEVYLMDEATFQKITPYISL